MPWFVRLVLLVLVGFALPVQATSDTRYQASRWVPERHDELFDAAAAEALLEVVIRVTGFGAARENAEIDAAMRQPRVLIEQFRYDREPRQDATTGQPEAGFRLQIQFVKPAIDQLIRRAGLPIWAGKRTAMIAWIAVDDGSERKVVATGSEAPLVSTVLEAAARRGVVLNLPLYDLQDQLAVRPSDIWGLFMDPLAAASRRYNVDAMLVGKLMPVQQGWRLYGVWREDGRDEWLDIVAADQASAMNRAVDQMVDKLAQRYAVVLDSVGVDQVALHVHNVNDLQAFARLSEYLSRLIPVSRVQLREARGSLMVFSLALDSDREQLRQLLIRDQRLSEISAAGSDTEPMQFRWLD